MGTCQRFRIHEEYWLCDDCGSCWSPRIVGSDWLPPSCCNRTGNKVAGDGAARGQSSRDADIRSAA